MVPISAEWELFSLFLGKFCLDMLGRDYRVSTPMVLRQVFCIKMENMKNQVQ